MMVILDGAELNAINR